MYLWIFLLAFSDVGALAQSSPERPSCRARRPMPDPLTKQNLLMWLGGNGDLVKDPGEFLCCLPAKYRTAKVLIGHSSIAGQSGSPESPRVILHPELAQSDGAVWKGEDLIFSINGGADYLTQVDSVEALQVDKAKGERNYIDYSIGSSGIYFPSENNPTKCMACHGDRNQVPKHGARPLFEPFENWTRFVGGVDACNPEFDKLQRAKQLRALEAIRDNPRFACLDKTGLTEDIEKLKSRKPSADVFLTLTHGRSGLSGFDSYLNEINGRRVARIIRDTPDYDVYKYVIYGAEACSSFKIEEWIPQSVLARHSNMSTIDPAIARLKTPKDLKEFMARKQAEAKKERAQAKIDLEDKESIARKPILPSRNRVVCKDPFKELAALPDLMMKFKPETVRAYKLDSFFRQPPQDIRGAVNGEIRFLFEGRGIDTSFWTMNMNKGDYGGGPVFVDQMVDLESKDSKLKQIVGTRGQNFRLAKDRDAQEEKMCALLKRASFEALSALPAPNQKTDMSGGTAR